MTAIAVRELAALFAGEPDDGGDMLTEPHPTVPLAVELCRALRPVNVEALTKGVYGDIPADEIPAFELQALRLGFERWVLIGKGRGL